ncbi:MAG: hypothetical protein GPOALKHO_000134 [Sodalis sp.]|uniref:hypothetical protein n=1 Tax=Sodalis sp. (in: enterobacteria) TaxID=1898979 RepID=UPI0038730B2D|nr:MAG: hypothetical protein GPOALKHO_000134 [Sodalis sp.]
MSPLSLQAPALSASGRLNHLLLLLYATMTLCSLTQLAHQFGTDIETTQRDLVQLDVEIDTPYAAERRNTVLRAAVVHRRVERDFDQAVAPPAVRTAMQFPPPCLADTLEHLLPYGRPTYRK